MINLKVRIFDLQNETMEYVDDLYYFEESYIHTYEDFGEYEVPMICSNKCDNGGSEIWEGDTMTNGYVTVDIEYDDNKAAFMGKYTHMEDEYEYLWKLINDGFLRSGNKYCSEH